MLTTTHSLTGVTVIKHANADNVFAIVDSINTAYMLGLYQPHLREIADIVAKIQTITEGAVICTSDRVLGAYGITVKGGIKAAFDKDVYSTKEDRQAYATKQDLELTTHVASDTYPEYWVATNTINSVWVDSKERCEEFCDAMSQILGHMLGLSVEIL